jgi:hypothetical protein
VRTGILFVLDLFVLDRAGGAERGVAAGVAVFRAAAFRAGAFLALVDAAVLRAVFTPLRGAALAVRRTRARARAVFFAFLVLRLLAAFRDADRPRLAPRRALALFRRAVLRLAIAPVLST